MSIQYYPGGKGFRWGKQVKGIWVQLDNDEQKMANEKHGVTARLKRKRRSDDQ